MLGVQRVSRGKNLPRPFVDGITACGSPRVFVDLIWRKRGMQAWRVAMLRCGNQRDRDLLDYSGWREEKVRSRLKPPNR